MPLPIFRMFMSERPSASVLFSAGRHYFFSDYGVSETRNLSYGPHKRHKLDIYEPPEITDQTEIIVFIHGGGWEAGSKELHRFIGRSWSRNNFIVILPNYRLVPDYTYPEQLHDITLCLSWIKNSYEVFNDSFYLAGHSAGAHLASMTGFSTKWLEAANLSQDDIAGFILLAGVYQFYPYERADKRVKSFVVKRRYWEEAQPINHLHQNISPVFIYHGGKDNEVLPEQSYQLRKRLSELGVESQLHVSEEAGHLELLFGTSSSDSTFWLKLLDFIR